MVKIQNNGETCLDCEHSDKNRQTKLTIYCNKKQLAVYPSNNQYMSCAYVDVHTKLHELSKQVAENISVPERLFEKPKAPETATDVQKCSWWTSYCTRTNHKNLNPVCDRQCKDGYYSKKYIKDI